MGPQQTYLFGAEDPGGLDELLHRVCVALAQHFAQAGVGGLHGRGARAPAAATTGSFRARHSPAKKWRALDPSVRVR